MTIFGILGVNNGLNQLLCPPKKDSSIVGQLSKTGTYPWHMSALVRKVYNHGSPKKKNSKKQF
jgi:hypothetical protein